MLDVRVGLGEGGTYGLRQRLGESRLRKVFRINMNWDFFFLRGQIAVYYKWEKW